MENRQQQQNLQAAKNMEKDEFKEAEEKAGREPDLYPKLPRDPGNGEIRNFWK